jgi:geranylgeranyl diphosphate synthase type II
MLVLMAAQACGGTIEAAMPPACAVEMIHAYSLIHDDLPAMDDDDLRRGRPTCHKVFGEALAILAGDALLALAFEVLAKGVQPPAVAAVCCAALAEAAGPAQLVGGQADDVGQVFNLPKDDALSCDGDGKLRTCPTGKNGAMASHPSSLELLESIHHRKTGAMIQASLRLGGMAVGAAPDQLAALAEYGRRFGLAFQVTDDLLDVRSDEATTGKRVGKDAGMGKLTYPGLLGIDRSTEYAGQLIAEACAAIAPLGRAAAPLHSLALYVIERNR